MILAPIPRTITRHGDTLDLPRSGSIAIPHAGLLFEAQWIQSALAETDCAYQIAVAGSGGTISLHENDVLGSQAYTLLIDDGQVTVTGGDAAGVFYGLCTLRQIMLNAGRYLPTLTIKDGPDFKHRGYMLDVSRDRVPTRAELFRLVDELAALKYNELQLYVEHTFAYPGHEMVWALADPLTPEDILLLDAYCKQRHIELVPNQNSLGHTERWLKHAPYNHLALSPDGFTGPDGRWRGPSTLSPTEPGSLELMRGLYEYLLPHFSSQRFNVGCDEPWELVNINNDADQTDSGRVYLDWLKRLYVEVSKHAYQMMFWGDIVTHHPALIPELPDDVVVLEWGYEATHPFAENCRRYADAGIPFYVCPGTSSWNALVGRTNNAIGNIQSAARHGLQHGAIGLLLTDWGDYGHWQPPAASYVGMVMAAACAWGYAQNAEQIDLDAALSQLIYREAADARLMGPLSTSIGDLYQRTGPPHINGSLLVYALRLREGEIAEALGRLAVRAGTGVDVAPATLRSVIEAVENFKDTLSDVRMQRPDAELLRREWRQAADLLAHGGKWLLLTQGETAITPAEMLHELDGLILQQRDLWLARSRRGGLDDSIRYFDALRGEYLK